LLPIIDEQSCCQICILDEEGQEDLLGFQSGEVFGDDFQRLGISLPSARNCDNLLVFSADLFFPDAISSIARVQKR
jgi:hypothetical protein